MFVYLQHSKMFKHTTLQFILTNYHDCIAKSIICQSCIIWVGSILLYPAAHHLQPSGTFVSIHRSSRCCWWISGSSLCFCLYLWSATCWFLTQVLNLFFVSILQTWNNRLLILYWDNRLLLFCRHGCDLSLRSIGLVIM